MVERRSIKLSSEEYERLEEEHVTPLLISQMLGEALVAAADVAHRRDKAFWDSVARLAGFGDRCEMRTAGYQAIVDWVSREIILKPHLEPTDQAADDQDG